MPEVDLNAIEVPGYRLLRALGRGAAATVFAATQRSLEREVAVKLFDALDAVAAARFEQCVRTNAQLSHAGILGIHQIGRRADGRLFYAMPCLLDAAPSGPRLRQRPTQVAALLHELLAALGYAHRRGIVHGGIKPANVLFEPNGRARLTDFGLARCASELGLVVPSAAAFLSPEQLRGNPPGQRSDLYSVGALAWTFLTGSPPFRGGSDTAVAGACLEHPVPRLPAAMAAWQPWFDRALAKLPEQRFQSTQAMADALPVAAARNSSPPVSSAGKHAAFPKWTWPVAALLVAGLVALGAWAVLAHRHATQSTTPVAATSDTPVAPPTAAPVAASTQGTLTSHVLTLLAQADALREGGHLFTPRGDNATGHYLSVLALDPGNAAATAGIGALLETARTQLATAWHQQRFQQALSLLKRCDALASHADRVAQGHWRQQRNTFAHVVGGAIATASRAQNQTRLAALQPLASALPAIYPNGFVASPSPPHKPPRLLAGAQLRDHGGPLLVYVPASDQAPAFAIARVEVTRADYAAFAQTTGRAAARCREAYNPFSGFRHLNWRVPGFVQGGNDPVVCVSWQDAAAYAAWLSHKTGATYRLPTAAQWLRAAAGMPKESPCQLGNVDDASRHGGVESDRWPCSDGAAETAPVGRYAASGVGAYDMYGNVSEWLAGGSPSRRPFRGLSWRDGNRQTPLGRHGTARANVGYTNVGFRVVRVIDATHPAPQPVGSHG